MKTEYWVVPSASSATLAEVRTTAGSGVAAQPVSMQYVTSQLSAKANDNAVVHTNGSETISGSKTGHEKKDAAMSFLENALTTVDAVASRDIVDPEKFKQGIGLVIDGVVLCLNASAWAKNAAASTVPAQP